MLLNLFSISFGHSLIPQSFNRIGGPSRTGRQGDRNPVNQAMSLTSIFFKPDQLRKQPCKSFNYIFVTCHPLEIN
jgi:hypothetical protein